MACVASPVQGSRPREINLPGTGVAGMFKATDPAFDRYTANPTIPQRQRIVNYFERMLVHEPYFDSRTSWYPRGLVYVNAYALYLDDDAAVIRANPDWVLKDRSGNNLYIPWGCQDGTCPQYAGDFGNPDFRQFILARVEAAMDGGTYAGIFLDDVNMDFRVGDGSGAFVNPIDPRTGAAMTETDWRAYMAGLTQLIRTTYPKREIAHNAIYYAGGSSGDSEPSVSKQLAAADWVNLERWVTDSGITAGTGRFGWQTIMSYIDRRHATGAQIICEGDAETNAAQAEYALASYWMINNGGDLIASAYRTDPGSWWSGWDVRLGAPTSSRYQWDGLWRRDFAAGMVLVREPTLSPVTVTLPDIFTTIAGPQVRRATLSGGHGLVLTK